MTLWGSIRLNRYYLQLVAVLTSHLTPLQPGAPQ